MKLALVKVSWTPSVSQDVRVQRFTVTDLDGELLLTKDLEPQVVSEFLELPEKTRVVVSLVVNDGVFDSVPATLEVVVDDLTAPQPVTNLTYEIVEIRDVEEKEVVEEA